MTLRRSLSPLTALDRQRLAELFRRHAGLAFSVHGTAIFERRLLPRVVALGLSSFGQYVAHLHDDLGSLRELEAALELVTTHETYFFRENYQLQAFRTDILPRLQQLASSRRRLVVWSAGCSTGEEAYTIAMLLVRSALFTGWELRVLGTDLSRRCLAAARRGAYKASAFREMPTEYQTAYFVDRGDHIEIEPQIRQLCTFTYGNVMESFPGSLASSVDAIFCRNVLIYLDQDAQQRVIANFHDRLLPGGFLLLGHAESFLKEQSGFEAVRLSGDLVYRKPEANAARSLAQGTDSSVRPRGGQGPYGAGG